MSSALDRVFRIPRRYKRAIQLVVDTLLLLASYLAALSMTLGAAAIVADPALWWVAIVSIPVSLATFRYLGFYNSVIRYIGPRALRILLIGIAISAIILVLTGASLNTPLPAPVPIDYALFSLFSVGGIRFILRALYQHRLLHNKTRVIVYGAGAAGSQLITSFQQGGEFVPIAFIDDWRGMHGTFVQGIRVHAPDALPRLIKAYGVQRILLAIPSATRARRREILEALEPLPIPVQTIPGVEDMVTGRASIDEIRDVAVEDLLGRDPVPPRDALLNANLRDKVVMVTGAGGSIGSELCRQIVRQRPRLLLLLEACEFSLYDIEQQLTDSIRKQGLEVSVKSLLGSVRDQPRLEKLMRVFGVQTIYHAAAYKHVPMVEYNTIEGIRNNVFGSLAVARAAIAGGVETFVLVSTDKAVRPTNVMGTTKRLAELICQALADHQATTRFCMVRFGNVLGSSGSVIPLFRKQIRTGGPITVTHPEITRYFMTIPEAAQLVLQAGAMGHGGDVFVLDMGEPVRITDLAAQMVKLSGLEVKSADTPHGDIEIRYTGLRPGEKLFEELLIGRGVTKTAHPRIMTAHEGFWPWTRLEEYLERLYAATEHTDLKAIRELLQAAPTDYRPEAPIADLTWCQTAALTPAAPQPATPQAPQPQPTAQTTELLKATAVSLTKGNSL